MLPSTNRKASATQTIALSVLNIPGHMHRYRRFEPTLAGEPARLAEICARFKLHNAGLSPAMFMPVSLAHSIAAYQPVAASWVAIFVHMSLGSLDVHEGRRFRPHQDTLFLFIDITPFIKILTIHCTQMSKSFTIRFFRWLHTIFAK